MRLVPWQQSNAFSQPCPLNRAFAKTRPSGNAQKAFPLRHTPNPLKTTTNNHESHSNEKGVLLLLFTAILWFARRPLGQVHRLEPRAIAGAQSLIAFLVIAAVMPRPWANCPGADPTLVSPAAKSIQESQARVHFEIKPTIRVQFGLAKGLVGCVLQVLLGEAPQADETRM